MVMTKWEVDEKAVADMLAAKEVGDFLTAAAQQALDYARSVAPVVTGRYKESLVVERPRIENGELLVGFGSTSSFWHLVEFGSANNQPHRVLSNAALQVADSVEFRG